MSTQDDDQVSFEIGYTDEGFVVIVIQPQNIEVALPPKATQDLIASLLRAAEAALGKIDDQKTLPRGKIH